MYISHKHDLTRWPVPAARSAAEGKRFDRMDLTILAPACRNLQAFSKSDYDPERLVRGAPV
jgi:hypothetical protein